jgi:hypothetical protein
LFSPVDKTYSHAGIISIAAGVIYVTHAAPPSGSEPGSVRTDNLVDYLSGSDTYKFLRLNQSEEVRSKVSVYALAAASEGLSFDTGFSLSSKEVYCTELIWKAVLSASSLDMAPKRRVINSREIISVDDIQYSGFLSEIE